MNGEDVNKKSVFDYKLVQKSRTKKLTVVNK